MKKRIHPDLFRTPVYSNYLQLDTYIKNKNIKALIVYQDLEIKKVLIHLLKKLTYNITDINIMRSYDTLNIDIYYSQFFLDANLINLPIKPPLNNEEQLAAYNFNQLKLNNFNYKLIRYLNFYKYCYLNYFLTWSYFTECLEEKEKLYSWQIKKRKVESLKALHVTMSRNNVLNINNLNGYVLYKHMLELVNSIMYSFNECSKPTLTIKNNK